MINRIDPDEESMGATILHRAVAKKPSRSWRNWLIGRPLPTADAPHQTIGKAIGLAVFAGDALSSVAYAPQETLVILAAAGTAGFAYAFPIAVLVTVLLAIVTISYQQTIHAYPGGGGAYTVARDNLGDTAALTAGITLLIDYILLAAVAVSSGAAPVSLPFSLIPISASGNRPDLLIMVANLRGVKISTAFAIPTYFFLATTFLMVGMGLFRYLTGTLGAVLDHIRKQNDHALQPVTLFLILRALRTEPQRSRGQCISSG
jgi:amino acid transporter